MANKKVSQLVAKPSVLVTDLFPIADPTTGQLFKTTISDLGTAIGSGVSSVNTLVGAVVLDTDDIQELASPTNRWFTDTRARAALSASSPLAYNSGTGAFSIAQANGSTNGFLSSADWTTFNAKQAALSGTGFVKISGTTISYDNSTYLTTSAAASTYLALAGGTLTGALNGTSATFTGDLTLSASNPRLYLTDTDNNPDYFISNTDGTFTIYDVTNSTSRFTIGTTGNGTFGGNLTVGQIIRSGGTSSQFLKADGSVDSSTYLTTGTAASTYVALTGNQTIAGQKTFSSSLFGTSGSFSTVVSTPYVSISADSGGNGIYLVHNSTFNSIVVTQSGSGSAIYATGKLTVIGTAYISGQVQFGSSTFLTNLTQTITLPTSSGTLALTSDLSAYLPLSGGTLTGALSGTSASFSGAVAIGAGTQAINSDAELTLREGNAFVGLDLHSARTSGNLGGIRIYNTSSTTDAIAQLLVEADGKFAFYNDKNATPRFTLASTGAATFSSSVTAAQAYFTNSSGDTVTLSKGSGPSIQFAKTDATAQSWALAGEGTAFKLYNYTAGTTPFLVTTSGNVGIGTTSPSEKLHIYSASVVEMRFENSTMSSYLRNQSDNFNFYVNGAERMRITSGGDLLVGSTTNVGQRMRLEWVDGGTGKWGIKMNMTDGGSANIIEFLTGGSVRGSITTNGTSVAYNTTSDYRLKEDLKPINGLEIVNKIKVYDYKWKSENSRMDGVLAHELAEVLPYAVHGIKDGEQMQGVDYSKIVPVMVQAIKDLKAELDTLKNK